MEAKDLKNKFLDTLFKKSSICMHCKSLACGHTNRTLTKKIDTDIILAALNEVFGE